MADSLMAKDYQPKEIESQHYERWEKAGYFKPSGNGSAYCIVIPPPNVTGTLHMGHAFQYTIMDALIRYHRMRGDNVLWQMGMDHAGIATQMVVERLLNAEGVSKHDLGRDAFIKRVWKWKEHSENIIANQMRHLGASVDWTRNRFTMDSELCESVTEEFVRLYEEGLIYRGKRLVNWDPVLHTALSDLEVLPHEEQGKLWRLRYPLAESDEYLIVATTRPETMLGDTAVAVHPDDDRYQKLVGHEVCLPLTGRPIPVLADKYVDPEFGTGCVKITPAHDFNDYKIGQRHKLPLINIFNEDATLNEAVPERYRGLDRLDARNKILEDLEADGLLDGEDDHKMIIPRGDRSGAVVEPLLTDQWYVSVQLLADPAIEDWCISRQLWWGHRIPAWYDEDEHVYVGRNEKEVREKHQISAKTSLRQDDDVLDTWFSSALWPFSTLGWPSSSKELDVFYPTNVLVTGFDIIFFWVARMIMMGLKFMDNVPFRKVYMTGLIRDHAGQKMSKSKGNILDPLDIIQGANLETLLEKRTEGMMQPHLKDKIKKATQKEFPRGIAGYGADALRMTLTNLATTGRDISLDMSRIEGNRNFCNKLWNAAHYVFTHIDAPNGDDAELTIADRWIHSRLNHVIQTVHQRFADYRFDLASQALYDFTWHEFCDWYLELTKVTLNDPNTPQAQGTRHCLAETLGTLLKLLHPIMPFVTEELWLSLCKRTGQASETLMLETFPDINSFSKDTEVEIEIKWVQDFVSGVRQIRGEMNISPSKKLPARLAGPTENDVQRVELYSPYLKSLGRLESVSFVATADEVPGAATALLGQMTLLVPLEGLINFAEERARLTKQQNQTVTELKKVEQKLTDPQFIGNAPEEVVNKQRARSAKLQERLTQLTAQLARLQDMN
jgi:valyl-tRNA synthetase